MSASPKPAARLIVDCLEIRVLHSEGGPWGGGDPARLRITFRANVRAPRLLRRRRIGPLGVIAFSPPFPPFPPKRCTGEPTHSATDQITQDFTFSQLRSGFAGLERACDHRQDSPSPARLGWVSASALGGTICPRRLAGIGRALGAFARRAEHFREVIWTVTSPGLFLGYRGPEAVSLNQSHGYFVGNKSNRSCSAWPDAAQSENLSPFVYEVVFIVSASPYRPPASGQ
ncbi:hypothetical protein M433DRAFT_28212 [Acidomyces richmondensis BFW]|nr:MAG: hypothetical protein FE78DRAFT_35125 [Acidomyces sp. 'richmondensis']KYG40390.1 hypothetical protein M433DRAFT_28212 [Acidomyces richmondensis BFW]